MPTKNKKNNAESKKKAIIPLKKTPEMKKIQTEKNRVRRIFREMKRTRGKCFQLARRGMVDPYQMEKLFTHMEHLADNLVGTGMANIANDLVEGTKLETRVLQNKAHTARWASQHTA